MKKRLFALLLALGMLTTMLSGCGNQAASAPNSEKAAPASVPEAAAPSEAPASAEKASSVTEESTLEEDAHEFAEGAGVFPIANGDETITIFDCSSRRWRNEPASRRNSAWRMQKPQWKSSI